MKIFKPIDKKIIIEYIETDITIFEICRKYKIGSRRFGKSIDFYRMNKRTKEEVSKNRSFKLCEISHSELYANKNEIIHQYTSGEKNSYELAEIYNCSQDKILLFLKNNNIKTLTYNEKQQNNKKDFIDKNIEEIKRLYCQDKLPCEQIGKIYNVNRETIRKFLMEHNVEMRDSPKFDGSKLMGASYILKYGTEEEKQKVKINMRKWEESDIDEKVKLINITRIGPIYNNSVKLQCNIDKHIWEYTPAKIMNGYGCPLCKNKTEKFIYLLLLSLFNNNSDVTILHNTYLLTYNFDNKNRKVYVDFIIKSKNKIIAVIEYNGIQHYQPHTFGRIKIKISKKNFIKQQFRDNEVEQYCIKNNYLFFSIDGRKYTLYRNNILPLITNISIEIRKNIL